MLMFKAREETVLSVAVEFLLIFPEKRHRFEQQIFEKTEKEIYDCRTFKLYIFTLYFKMYR